MIWLVMGVLLWSVAHLFPAVAAPARADLAKRLGPPYQGVFSLVILASIVLMVLGWRSAEPTHVYLPPTWGRVATNVLLVLALWLFVVSAMASNVKRVLRHPQLTGLVTWSVAHLLSNGDARSLVLFGGLGVWAIVGMLAINRRDGAWQKPDALPMSGEWKIVAIALAGFALLYLAHPYFAGVPATPHF